MDRVLYTADAALPPMALAYSTLLIVPVIIAAVIAAVILFIIRRKKKAELRKTMNEISAAGQDNDNTPIDIQKGNE